MKFTASELTTTYGSSSATYSYRTSAGRLYATVSGASVSYKYAISGNKLTISDRDPSIDSDGTDLAVGTWTKQ